jgi:single-stranded-DNA-specific exonuclease
MNLVRITNKIWKMTSNYRETIGGGGSAAPVDVELLAKEAGISALTARILLSRGINQSSEIKKFLQPQLEHLHDPYLLNDMDKAVERILAAVKNREKIMIYGDYDADGVTSTAILHNFLTDLRADVDYYIPDRMDEGYGLSIEALEKIISSNVDLIITVDCGVTAHEEVDFANSAGIDIIITDHHQCLETLPEALAVINPCRPDSKYPFSGLAGVGVVFKLIHAICLKFGLKRRHLRYLDLVAIGTIADIVELRDENRIIVHFGLILIKESLNQGLRSLISVSGYKGKAIDTYTVGFILAPRINAAGRVGDARRAVKLFTSSDPRLCNQIAEELDRENKHRIDTEQGITEQAISLIEADVENKNRKVLLVAGEGWHSGVIGISASKITEKYYKPTLLISIENGIGKGSARSIKAFNLFEALKQCDDILEKFGGHEMAAGFSVLEENIDELTKRINEIANKNLTEEDMIPHINIDAYIDKCEISKQSAEELACLAPFGPGNPKPVLACRNMKIISMKEVGNNKHLKLKISCGDNSVDAIGFNMGGDNCAFSDDDIVDLAFALELNEWNNRISTQLNLKDVRVNGEKDHLVT